MRNTDPERAPRPCRQEHVGVDHPLADREERLLEDRVADPEEHQRGDDAAHDRADPLRQAEEVQRVEEQVRKGEPHRQVTAPFDHRQDGLVRVELLGLRGDHGVAQLLDLARHGVSGDARGIALDQDDPVD